MGPIAIPPTSCPGGIVIHVYDRAGVLIQYRELEPSSPASFAGEIDATAFLRAGADITIVAFDGDTGERMGPGSSKAFRFRLD